MDCGLNCEESYSEEYDSFYCKDCNKWLEDKCNDSTCEYCLNRPPNPLGDKNGNT